jgi:hypothetical protein
MEFSVADNEDGTLNLRARAWNDGDPPGAWLEVPSWHSALFQGRAGHYGVVTAVGNTGRTAFLDNLNAVVDDEPPLTVVEEKWTGSNGATWPAQWTHQGSPLSVTIQSNEGQIWGNGSGGTALEYISGHSAQAVEILTQVRTNAGNARGGVFALRADSDSDSYVGVKFGTTGFATDNARIFAVVDGVQTDLDDVISTFASNVTYWLRFRVEQNGDGTLNLYAKIWESGSEPGWLLSVANWSSPLFAGRSGRFGVLGNPGQSGRKLFFDEFTATFVEAN